MKGIGVCAVATAMAIAFLYWATALQAPPILDYLNWYPGTRVLWELASSFALRGLAIAALCSAIGVGVVRKSPVAYVMGIAFATVLGVAGIEVPAKRFAQLTGIAREACWNPGTFECVLNDFQRRYDFGWSRSWTQGEERAYRTYAQLRAESGPVKTSILGRSYFGEHTRWAVANAGALEHAIGLPTCSPAWADLVAHAKQCEFRHAGGNRTSR